MHEKIGELVNQLVYSRDGNALEHHALDSRTDPGRRADPEPKHPIVLCDTTSANPWCASLEPGYSRYNIYSAVTAIRLAQQVVETANGNGIEVAIICPYSAQARLLNALAGERGLTGKVKVATVHRFQGNEKDVIIVALVEGPKLSRREGRRSSVAGGIGYVQKTTNWGAALWVQRQAVASMITTLLVRATGVFRIPGLLT